jgi:hypothetical protein
MTKEKSILHSPEQAWFSAQFSAFNEEGSAQARLYLYPRKDGERYPADIRVTASEGDTTERVFEGEVEFDGSRLKFFERSDSGLDLCTLSAVKATDEVFLGGPETNTGLFEPEMALRISQLRDQGQRDGASQGGRAAKVQLRSMVGKGRPVEIRIDQHDKHDSTLH